MGWLSNEPEEIIVNKNIQGIKTFKDVFAQGSLPNLYI